MFPLLLGGWNFNHHHGSATPQNNKRWLGYTYICIHIYIYIIFPFSDVLAIKLLQVYIYVYIYIRTVYIYIYLCVCVTILSLEKYPLFTRWMIKSTHHLTHPSLRRTSSHARLEAAGFPMIAHPLGQFQGIRAVPGVWMVA